MGVCNNVYLLVMSVLIRDFHVPSERQQIDEAWAGVDTRDVSSQKVSCLSQP